MTEKLNNWLNNAQLLIFPPQCFLCQNPGTNNIDLCTSCKESFEKAENFCPVCAEPLPQPTNTACGQCQQKPPFFDAIFSPYLYQGKCKKLLHQYKFSQNTVIARLIAQLLLEFWQQQKRPQIDAVYAIPSHPQKKRQRGFNQSELIQTWFCRLQKIPLTPTPLARVRWQGDQVTKNRQQRQKQIKNAFILAKEQTPAKKVLLIDDVVTTGATVNEAARILKKHGSEHVWVLSFARTAKN